MRMALTHLLYEVSDGIGYVTLNRPEALNAINRRLHGEIVETLTKAEQSDEVRVVVIGGVGRAFSAGHDLKQDLSHPLVGLEAWRSAFKASTDLALQIWNSSKPVIGAVNGYCLGKGLDIALACDIVVASESATFGFPEVKFGAGSIFPILQWVVGVRKAKELMLTGDRIDAAEAEAIGLVNRTVPDAELKEEVARLAAKLAALPPTSLALNKRMLNRNLEVGGLSSAVAYSLEFHSAVAAIVGEKGERAEFTERMRESGLKAALDDIGRE
jgi:enoyl-CoA hydratase/carnithine racemase